MTAKIRSNIEDETNVVALEARRDSAEKSFLIIAGDSKRLQSENNDLDKSIIKKNRILSDIDSEIEKSNSTLSEIKSSILSANKQLEEIANEKKHILNLADSDIELANKERDRISVEINSLLARHKSTIDNCKNESSQAFAYIEQLNIDIENLSTKRDEIIRQISQHQKEVGLLVEDIRGLNDEMQSATIEVRKLSESVKKSNALLEESKRDLEVISKDIKNGEAALVSLSIEKEKAEEHLYSLERKAGSILAREDAIGQREEFIKLQYERIGVKWQ